MGNKVFNDVMVDTVKLIELQQQLERLVKGLLEEIQNLNKDIFLLLDNSKNIIPVGVCPSCGQKDDLFLNDDYGGQQLECVNCGYKEEEC